MFACHLQPQQYGQPQMMQYGQYQQQQMAYGMPYGSQVLPDMYYQQAQAQQAALSQQFPAVGHGGPPSYPAPQARAPSHMPAFFRL